MPMFVAASDPKQTLLLDRSPNKDRKVASNANTSAFALDQCGRQAALSPLGCMQKGRSRTWLDDRSWWIGVVEFQPSAWARGSYLNVGACWLWYEKEYLSFDDGHRVESFQSFASDEQFASVAEKLAQRASQEVMTLRQRFPSFAHVQAWLAAKSPTSICITTIWLYRQVWPEQLIRARDLSLVS